MKEYYQRLFLNDGASIDEVKKAYRKLVKKFHPDKNQESNEYTEEFKLIQDAYEKLVDFLEKSKKTQTVSTMTEKTEPSSSGGGLVKSEAKYAEKGDEKRDETFMNVFMPILVALFIVCGFYAAIQQESMTFKILLFASFATLTGFFILSFIKKSLKN